MMFFKVLVSVIDALVLIFTVMCMAANKNDSDKFVPMFCYGMAVVVICMVAGLGMWA